MAPDFNLPDVLKRHGVPFVLIGGHAVNVHGYVRNTEDTDIIWIRSPSAEQNLFNALTEVEACYIGKEIDPVTKIERTYPVTLSFVQVMHLMMLCTKYGFLDLFDYIPGHPQEDPALLTAESIEVDGYRFASLDWLTRMKRAAGRPKDLIDLENLSGNST
jgi:hypothetical protein